MPAIALRVKSGRRPLHVFSICWIAICLSSQLSAAEQPLSKPTILLLRQFCVDCHGKEQAEAQLNLESMIPQPAFEDHFKTWRKVVDMLEQKKMPPEGSPQPEDSQRRQLLQSIRRQLQQVARQYAQTPGPIVMRRLTSAEYAYTIQYLTGLELNLERDIVGDSVGGEGFTNVGAVQFIQDSTLESYLAAAKKVATHAVIGAGPLQFHEDPGQTGFELSAITRIQKIYRRHGFRTAAGEGGEPFGLDLYPRAFYTAWLYRHRNALGRGNVTLALLAAENELDSRFVHYLWSIVLEKSPSFPISTIVERWNNLPSPRGKDDPVIEQVRKQCDDLYKYLHGWQNSLGQNADDKEQAFTLAAETFEVSPSKSFVMSPILSGNASRVKIFFSVETIETKGNQSPTVIWRDPTVQFRIDGTKLEAPQPLSSILSPNDARMFSFGRNPSSKKIGPDDFVTNGATKLSFDLPFPPGATSAKLAVDTELDLEQENDCIVRCFISEEETFVQGKSVSGIIADPNTQTFKSWKPGVIEFARKLPQVSNREPAPSDRDPIPPPFDNSYNNPERNLFHYKIKYHRDDQFLVDHMLDDQTKKRLDQAWTDLLGSFEYHDAFLRFVAEKYKLDLHKRRVATMESSWIDQLPDKPRKYVRRLYNDYRSVQNTFSAARPGHLDDTLEFAGRAWRRPITDHEKDRLISFYESLQKKSKLDHQQSIRALLARILTSPNFLYRSEQPTAGDSIVPLSDWELASRLSYFLWASPPDEELRRVATAGKLANPQQLAQQAKRMLRDPKSRRLATEFFGQWFGFYQFDQYRGVDPKRFPEFTESLKAAMYDEAISFFEHVIRQDRPVGEILFADYVIVNRELAKHYEIDTKNNSSKKAQIQRVENVRKHHRGGLLGMGAVLTTTSAPRRTSPVKRGDWILRRVLGTPVPPPPADAGSIPADDVLTDGLTMRERLEVHRRNRSCRNCHSRIDPLGFSLENYDALGRWRDQYRDGKQINVSSQTEDGAEISGREGLLKYLKRHQNLFYRTLCTKLVGYAFGRSESIYDAALIEDMMAGLDDREQDSRFSTLVEKIVRSKQFRFQQARLSDGKNSK